MRAAHDDPSTVTAEPARYYPAGAGPQPGSPHAAYVAERISEIGSFGDETVSDHVRRHARERPQGIAYIVDGHLRTTWSDFDAAADLYAALLCDLQVQAGERVAVLYPDSSTVHALYVGIERAGAVVMGIGPRAGAEELLHLLSVTAATVLITPERVGDRDMKAAAAALRQQGVPLRHHVIVPWETPRQLMVDGAALTPSKSRAPRDRQLGIGDLFMLNSTSGTTGMPKCVAHNQNRWFYYHQRVLQSIDFDENDVFLSLIPAPYGFGLWTAHVTPLILGCTTVVMSRFNAAGAVSLIASEQVTAMHCVSTQFVMMLNTGELDEIDASSLRCMFTGGEAIPFERAAQFERSTGAKVLNFYGSNETGTLSHTSASDDTVRRLTTCGRVIDEMNVRLFDESGEDVTATGGPGQAACRGPATSWGYYADPAANAALFTDDGWMLTGDVCTIDEEGVVKIVDRKSDFIIRGGKNISAAAVEERVGTHPAVSLAAAVAVSDEVFGERVCAVVVLREGHELDLAQLRSHLADRGVSKELWPERLVITDELPRAAGGKVAKAQLRRRLAEEDGEQHL